MAVSIGEGKTAHPNGAGTRGHAIRLLEDSVSHDQRTRLGHLFEALLAAALRLVGRTERGESESITIGLLPAKPAIGGASRSGDRGDRVLDRNVDGQADEPSASSCNVEEIPETPLYVLDLRYAEHQSSVDHRVATEPPRCALRKGLCRERRGATIMNSTSIKSRLSQIIAVAAVIVVGAVVIVIATNGPTVTSTADTGVSSGSGDAVEISDFKYDPPDLSVSTGSKVTFTNEDTAMHTATSDTEGAFDTDDLAQGDSATVTLDKPGTFTYYCRFHSFMKGTITVK